MKITEFLQNKPTIQGWKTKLIIDTINGEDIYKSDDFDYAISKNDIPDLYVDVAVVNYDFRRHMIGIGIVSNTKEVDGDWKNSNNFDK